MAIAQANEPTTRPKNPAKSDIVEILVPKEDRDDEQNPHSLIHRYLGEDAEVKGAVKIGETPRQYKIAIERKEAEAYNQRCIDEAKGRLKRSDLKGLGKDEIQEKRKVSLAEYAPREGAEDPNG